MGKRSGQVYTKDRFRSKDIEKRDRFATRKKSILPPNTKIDAPTPQGLLPMLFALNFTNPPEIKERKKKERQIKAPKIRIEELEDADTEEEFINDRLERIKRKKKEKEERKRKEKEERQKKEEAKEKERQRKAEERKPIEEEEKRRREEEEAEKQKKREEWLKRKEEEEAELEKQREKEREEQERKRNRRAERKRLRLKKQALKQLRDKYRALLSKQKGLDKEYIERLVLAKYPDAYDVDFDAIEPEIEQEELEKESWFSKDWKVGKWLRNKLEILKQKFGGEQNIPKEELQRIKAQKDAREKPWWSVLKSPQNHKPSLYKQSCDIYRRLKLSQK